jgi:hypothetical protein
MKQHKGFICLSFLTASQHEKLARSSNKQETSHVASEKSKFLVAFLV